MQFHLRSLLAAALLLLVSLGARAQVVDLVEWRKEGNDAVLEISFNVPVQFLRAVVAASNDIAQAFYELRPTGDLPQFIITERRVAPSDGLPGVSVSDEAVRGLLSRKLVIRFDRAVKMRVRAGRGNNTIDVVIAGAGPAADARGVQGPPPAPEDRFLVTLQQSNDPNLRMEVPVPSELAAYQLFTARRVVDGQTVYEINLGYFSTRAEAERAQRVLAQRFPQATVVDLTPQTPPTAVAAVREPVPSPPAEAPPQAAPSPPPPPAATEEGVLVPVPAPPPVPAVPQPPGQPTPPKPPPGQPPAPQEPPAQPSPAQPPVAEAPPTVVVPPAPPPSAPAEIDQRGRVLLAQGRAAMDKGDLDQAVGLFNQLLNLPPNVASQDGQELIGFARARQGDLTRARAEFELYLKLYPTGPGADRVRAGLAQLAGTPGAPEKRTRTVAPLSLFTGSFSQYYYGGRSLVSTVLEGTPVPGTPLPSTDPISNVDQKLLQTSLDLNYRYRDATKDVRAVFRDTYTKNYLEQSTFSTRAPNRLNTAYVEYRSLPVGVSARVGRQSPTGDGVLSTFDGARVGYTFMPRLSVNAVAGVPTDDLYDTKRRFYGFSLDTENLGDHVSASLYTIQQTVDSETDRRAVGTELRYFDPNTSVFGVYDYDTLFHATNIASLQGTWQMRANTVTFSFLADRRAAPILATANALLQPDQLDPTGVQPPVIHRTLTDFLQYHSLDYARQLAKATTAYVEQGLLGVSVQATPDFQYSLDARLTNVGALPGFDPGGGVPPIPPQPATGNIYSYTAQTIFSNLYSQRDTHVFSLTYINAPEITQALGGQMFNVPGYKGLLFSYNNTSLVWERLQLEPAIRYYKQNNTDGKYLKRWSPGLRVSWRVTQKFTIEGDMNYERAQQSGQPLADGTPTTEKATRTFYFVGYRYDF